MTRSHSGPGRRPQLLCLSHLRWGFVWQRPQHLLCRAAAHYDVFYFEEPFHSHEVTEPFLHRVESDGVTVLVPHLPAGYDRAQTDDVLRDMLDLFLEENVTHLDVLWYYTPRALAFSRHIAADLRLYDCMDQLSAFKGADPALAREEDELFTCVDLVTCGGRMLFEEKRARHPNVHLFPSSIEYDHFARARPLAKARDRNGAPVLGFFGVIDERLDLELVDALAALRPQWRIVMIGPVAKISSESLPRRRNIEWRGPAAYQDLPNLLAQWDVGIMPFAINEATRFISPTKTPEFLAAGLPVISTPISDVILPYGQFGLVEIASTPADHVAAVVQVLARPYEPWLKEVDAFLKTTSWDRTFEAIHHLILRDTRSEAVHAWANAHCPPST